VKTTLLGAFWLGACLWTAQAQVAVLHIQVIEGNGAVHLPGARSLRPLTVVITDETGRPVEGAAVTFHLPEAGPGGTFANQLRTDVVTTDAQGRASVRSLQVNHQTGPFQIRIVAVKEQAHAGTVSSQYVAEARGAKASTTLTTPEAAPTRSTPASTPAASRSALKWVVIAIAAGGAAAAGALLAGKAAAPNGASTAIPAPTVGIPTITVSKP